MMQKGRTLECGHCFPDKYEMLPASIICECTCHDESSLVKSSTPHTDEWREEFYKQFLGMAADYKEEEELLIFIDKLLLEQRTALKQEVEEIFNTFIITYKEGRALSMDKIEIDVHNDAVSLLLEAIKKL